MKKIFCLVGSVVLALLTVLIWGLASRFEAWVVPRIVGSVVDSTGEAIEISESEISISNETVGSVDIKLLGAGEFTVPPKKAMLPSMIGYSCTDTRITVNVEGYKVASREFQLCNDEQLVERPVLEFRVIFRLASDLDVGESSTEATRVDRFLESVTDL